MSGKILDTRGLKCPLPVLRAEKYLQNCPEGTQFVLLADDPVAQVDIPVFCQNNGHDCSLAKDGSFFSFNITAKKS